mgnify:FL=1
MIRATTTSPAAAPSGRQLLLLVLVYLGAHLLSRTLISGALELDEIGRAHV